MNCADCGQPTGKRYGRYCDAHRWRHRGKPSTYRLTLEREAYLKAHYRPSERGISLRCAKILGVPKWRVCRWAAELGLTGPTTKGRDWTPAEDAILEAHVASRHINWIAKRLGRSITAVRVRSKRLSISLRGARTWYTARQVGDGFGVDSHVVTRWIKQGKLKATTEGQPHADGQPCMWRITPEAVRAFIQQHPTAFSLAKVEPIWFLDLVFNGWVGKSAERRVA